MANKALAPWVSFQVKINKVIISYNEELNRYYICGYDEQRDTYYYHTGSTWVSSKAQLKYYKDFKEVLSVCIGFDMQDTSIDNSSYSHLKYYCHIEELIDED